MPINCLVNRRVKETKRQKDKESKRQRVKETKRRRDKESKRKSQSDKKKKGQRRKPRKPLEEYGGCAAAVMLPFWSYKSMLLTPNRQHPPCLLSEGCILFKAINRNKPFNGSTMNSPPTLPSFTFYIFQIEIYGGNLSEEIEYKGNYFLNLSLISEHFARFVFQTN